MTDQILLNITSHVAMCVFLYSQYREQCTKKWLIELLSLLFVSLSAAEIMSYTGVSKIIVVIIQTVMIIAVGLLAMKKFSLLIFINTFNGETFVLPGNIIGNLMLVYIPAAVSPYLTTFFALLVCVAFHVLVLLAASMYIGSWLHSFAANTDFPWSLMFLLPIFYYISIFLLIDAPQEERVPLLNLVCALVVTVLTVIAYALAIQILRYQKRNSDLYYYNAEYELMIDQMSKRLDMTKESQRQTAVLRHDMRHMVRIVSRLLEDDEVEMAKGVLENYDDSIAAASMKTFCKNVVLNSVLEYNAAVCAENDIVFEVQADLKEKMAVSDMELAVVLSNLLENAINAAKEAGKTRKINFLAMEKAENLIIEISNTFTGELDYDEQTRLPVSSHGTGHGLGMQSVKIFAKKNGAVFDFGEENGMFFARLLLQNQF